MRIYFVGGCQRSGTQLLNAVVCADRRATPFPRETKLFRGLAATLASALREVEQKGNCDFFQSAEQCEEWFRDVFLRLIDDTTRRFAEQFDYVTFSDPKLTPHYPLLARLQPDWRFIVSLRDPRDVAASFLQVGQRQIELGQRAVYTEQMLPLILQEYCAAYSRKVMRLAETAPPCLCVVRYEALAGLDATEMEKIRRFVDAPLDLLSPTGEFHGGHWRTLSQKFEDPFIPPVSKPFHTPLRGMPISAASVGKFRRILSARAIAEIEAATRALFADGCYFD